MSRRQFLLRATQAVAATGLPVWAHTATAAEEALTARSVTLGCSIALTGPLGQAGIEQVAGMKAAFAEVNQAGGVNGREIRLEVKDDAYVAARTLQNVTEMLDAQSVFALISPLGTANTAAIVPLIESKGIPTVGPVTGATSLRSPEARHVFFLRPTYREETQRLVKQVVDMGLKRIAVVYLDNPFGKEVLKDMSRALDEIKVERAGEYALAVDGKNGAELADKVAAERPGAVLLATTGTANTAFVQAFRPKAPGVPLAGLSVTVVSSELPKLAANTRGLALVQVFPDATSQKSVVVRKFQSSMKATGALPAYLTSGSALEGWLNAQIMVEGLKNAGKEPTRERLRAGLAGIRSLSFGDFNIGFGSKAPYIGSDAIYLAIYADNGRRVS
ncbi:MAG: ABC transporter substrate-binding protein [Acidovorax sp.]|jgi:ABC-type branched-subunit amino acid transport system substrate-binding protein|uniref:ABC transporter substrate-binding protein n=1 Tax=Acidovorax sp. TaxID=1872122 RepID=UPI000A3DEAF0|nr:ABC transporter substrate-binding protein [Acidovorax sp.]MCO4093356.1 ABC transporter substrate-binding protein [Acidovorax sp.]MDH4428104.1 ABC transporter substrate-binding protein [Acidovorax sp.]MDH4448139.1 ABC transporter substrate-binding protein [Acidovorax sp.]MDH4462929.1 ABC transporter substrate-binding protein [Acidovorax sp.]